MRREEPALLGDGLFWDRAALGTTVRNEELKEGQGGWKTEFRGGF